MIHSFHQIEIYQKEWNSFFNLKKKKKHITRFILKLLQNKRDTGKNKQREIIKNVFAILWINIVPSLSFRWADSQNKRCRAPESFQQNLLLKLCHTFMICLQLTHSHGRTVWSFHSWKNLQYKPCTRSDRVPKKKNSLKKKNQALVFALSGIPGKVKLKNTCSSW